jgi:type I restriction enzyme S subunit
MKTTKATIEDILISSHSGFACSKQYETTEKEGVFHMRPNNIGYWGKINLTKKVFIQKSKIEPSKVGVTKGQILFNNTNSKELVGRAVFVSEDIDAGFSNHLTRLIVDETQIDPRWLTYQINKLWSEGYFLRICRKWIGQAGVDMKMLKSIEIEYPELAEQERIADNLDKVFVGIENGVAFVEKTSSKSNALKQSVVSDFFAQSNFVDHKLSDIAEINPKKDFEALKPSDEVSFVPMDSVDDVTGTITKKLTRKLDTVSKGYTFFRNGDVIFAKITPCMENGKCAVVSELTNSVGFGSTEFYVVRANENILSEYLWLFLRQEGVRSEAKTHFTGAAGHKRVPKSFMDNLEVPVPMKNGKPDLVEQRRIVDELGKVSVFSEKLNDLLRKQKGYFSNLRSSVLSRSFQMQT